jgi:glutathione S-transferase
MVAPIVYGPTYSTFARTARLALEEKSVPYELVEVGILDGGTKKAEHLARHPFGLVPAFEHDGFALYETGAILRYVDQVFPTPPLTPEDPRRRARMNQIISILESYGYNALITRLFINRMIMPMMGGQVDEKAIEEGLPRARISLSEIDRLLGNQSFLAGDDISLADLYLIPIYAYVSMTPESKALLGPLGNLARWWQAVASRPSVLKTAPKL